MWVTPRCAKASTTALVKQGMPPTCGDSATPLAPSGWCGQGVTVWSVSHVGVSTAVKDFNAVLVTNLQSLQVECLPTDLPERIDIDIAVLARPGDGIRVRDVKVPDKVRLLDDPDTMVAVATFAKVEEEAAAVPGAEAVTPTATEPELAVERGKKEEEGEE